MVKTSPKPKTIFPFVPDTVAPAGSAATAATMTASSTRKRTRPPMRNLISPPLPGAKAEEGWPAAVLGPNRDSLIPSLRKFKHLGRFVAEPPFGDMGLPETGGRSYKSSIGVPVALPRKAGLPPQSAARVQQRLLRASQEVKRFRRVSQNHDLATA